MNTKTALIIATTAAIALAGFDMRPAQAAPEGGPAIVKQNNGADEFSSQKKRRRGGRGVNPAVPLAAFGAIIGTIGAIAAANRQRDYYYGDGYYYGGPRYVAPQPYYAPQQYYAPPPRVYHAPRPHARPHYAPGPRHGGWNTGPRHLGPNDNAAIRSQNPQSGSGTGGL